MRVNIDEIKEGGLQRSWDLARESVDEMVRTDNAGYRARGPLHVEAQLQRMDGRVLLTAKARGEVTAPCGRCLASVDVDVPIDFQVTFVPGSDDPREQHMAREERDSARVAGSFGAEDVNEEVYSGKVIDLDPVVREQLLLALPGYPVCQEACKGLCPVCGANLNERDCGCDRRVPDPRWAGLEKLKAKSKEE
jgi:uncharacterized protein